MATNGSDMMSKVINGLVVLAVVMVFFSFVWGAQNSARITAQDARIQALSDRIESDRRIDRIIPSDSGRSE